MKKRSKLVILNYYENKQGNLIKKQYKITLPKPLIDQLKWEKGDILKIWINNKKHLEIRKKT